MPNFLPSRQYTARLGLRNLLSVGNFSALATAFCPAWAEILSIICLIFWIFSAHMTVYVRLGLRNLLSVGNFSALATAFCPAWTEKSAVCRKFLCPRDSIRRLGLRNLLPGINFSALATVYARLRQRNTLPEIIFSALATAFCPAWAEKYAP